MSVGAAATGIETSTAYQREKAEKELAGTTGVSKTDFLKLLTTQLTHQDPLNPSQDIDFTAQLAQLQALDEQMSMTSTMKSLRTDMQIQAGTAMIGKYVSGTDSANGQASGLVDRIVSTSDGIFVELSNKKRIPVENISNVWDDANAMNTDISQSTGIIGKWIEAGYDENYQPIKGIVESVGLTKEGTVVLNLFGGKSVSWSQVEGMREPTEAELLYTLPDEIRKQLETAGKIIGMTVTGKDANGKTVTGIVAGAGLTDDMKKVTVTLMTGEIVEYGSITDKPRKPNAEEAAKAFGKLWVGGLDKDGNDVVGIVVGAEDLEDGTALILDDGRRLYLDALDTVEEASEESMARLHGKYAEGVNADGDGVSGFIVEKLEVDGKLAVRLSGGQVVLCKDLTLVRDPTEEEQDDSDQALEDAENADDEEDAEAVEE